MEIGGFQKLSLIDYKGKVACIVFTIGCNLRCPFCYVPQLVIPDKAKKLKRIPEEEIFRYLEKNKYLLDGVVITGGEPTLQKDLKEFIKKVKKIGNFSIAIETNGTNPKVLKELIDEKLVDHVSMDIKNVMDFKKYKKATGVLKKEDFENIKKSIELIKKVSHEFRTTIVKGIHEKEDIINLAKKMKEEGENYYIQGFKRPGPLVGKMKLSPFTREEISEALKYAPHNE